MQGLRHCQVSGTASSLRGHSLSTRQRPTATRLAPASCVCSTQLPERLRLDNLSPQEGARHRKRRIGRGYGAGQGGSCGAGMRGQKARSGSTPKPGFEGGQMPLYRRLPKLRGIAGGMKAGVQRFVTINVGELGLYEKDEVVDLSTLEAKNLLTASGRESRLPLKILGHGDMVTPLKIRAVEFSKTAREKIEQAGGTIEEVPAKVKWTKQLGKELKAKREEAAAKAAPKASAKASPKASPKASKK